jgi:hypothetical protein
MQVSLAHAQLTFRPRSVKLTRMRDHAVRTRVFFVLKAAFAAVQIGEQTPALKLAALSHSLQGK